MKAILLPALFLFIPFAAQANNPQQSLNEIQSRLIAAPTAEATPKTRIDPFAPKKTRTPTGVTFDVKFDSGKMRVKAKGPLASIRELISSDENRG